MEVTELYIHVETGAIVEFYDICMFYDTLRDELIIGALYSYLEPEDLDGIIENDIYAVPLDDFFKAFTLVQFPDYDTCINFCESSR